MLRAIARKSSTVSSSPRAVGPWDPEWVVGTPDWDADFSDTKAAAAALALWGSPGAGADYRWQDAGCQGAATEALGISS